MTLVLFMRVPQADLLYPHRAIMESYYGSLPAYTGGGFEMEKNASSSSDVGYSARRSASAEAPSSYYTGYTNNSIPSQQPSSAPPAPDREASLSQEQRTWLQQMVQTYGPTFEREKWVQTFIEQNHEAALKAAVPVQVQPEVSSYGGYDMSTTDWYKTGARPKQTGSNANTSSLDKVQSNESPKTISDTCSEDMR